MIIGDDDEMRMVEIQCPLMTRTEEETTVTMIHAGVGIWILLLMMK